MQIDNLQNLWRRVKNLEINLSFVLEKKSVSLLDAEGSL
jgi:hypothetical protein